MDGRLTLLCGLSGSGKSTYIERLRRVSTVVVLCPDEFRRVLLGQDFYRPAEEMVWSHVKTAARVLVRNGYSVLIDATNLTVGSRAQWIAIAHELDAIIDCVVLNVPLVVCMARQAERERKVPESVMLLQAESFVLPTIAEGFGSIQVIEYEGQSSEPATLP